MRYEIIKKETVTIIHVIEPNIFFGYNDDPEYDVFKRALETKGIEVFIDLLIADSNTAFNLFCL